MPARLGEFELLLLLLLADQADDPDAPHGATLRAAIAERTGRQVLPGALYNALDRLERRGLVTSWLGDPTPQRGGKRKRHYRIEPMGRTALAEGQSMWRALMAHPSGAGESPQ
jgi:DNA-binding PadR family transcriptional regulator